MNEKSDHSRVAGGTAATPRSGMRLGKIAVACWILTVLVGVSTPALVPAQNNGTSVEAKHLEWIIQLICGSAFATAVALTFAFVARRTKKRLRFGLRTLFVVVTVVACWLGYSGNWIRRRNEILSRPDVTSAGLARDNIWLLPWTLRIFGEEGCHQVLFSAGCDREVIEQAVRLFPEAEVWWMPSEDTGSLYKSVP
jgi:hypothetical protein